MSLKKEEKNETLKIKPTPLASQARAQPLNHSLCSRELKGPPSRDKIILFVMRLRYNLKKICIYSWCTQVISHIYVMFVVECMQICMVYSIPAQRKYLIYTSKGEDPHNMLHLLPIVLELRNAIFRTQQCLLRWAYIPSAYPPISHSNNQTVFPYPQ